MKKAYPILILCGWFMGCTSTQQQLTPLSEPVFRRSEIASQKNLKRLMSYLQKKMDQLSRGCEGGAIYLDSRLVTLFTVEDNSMCDPFRQVAGKGMDNGALIATLDNDPLISVLEAVNLICDLTNTKWKQVGNDILISPKNMDSASKEEDPKKANKGMHPIEYK